MAEVDLTELETIRRFSLATRGETAPIEEVVEALRADLDALASLMRPPAPAPRKRATAGRSTEAAATRKRATGTRTAAPTSRAAASRAGTAASSGRRSAAAAPDPLAEPEVPQKRTARKAARKRPASGTEPS